MAVNGGYIVLDRGDDATMPLMFKPLSAHHLGVAKSLHPDKASVKSDVHSLNAKPM